MKTETDARASALDLIARAMTKRTEAGLKVTFLIPADAIGPAREWACFPKDMETRARWIEDKAKLGWTVVE
ncbi:hypothetical protein ACC862_24135 [Rhizobium ruizarguesonis]